jgi:hypothetical protein
LTMAVVLRGELTQTVIVYADRGSQHTRASMTASSAAPDNTEIS